MCLFEAPGDPLEPPRADADRGADEAEDGEALRVRPLEYVAQLTAEERERDDAGGHADRRTHRVSTETDRRGAGEQVDGSVGRDRDQTERRDREHAVLRDPPAPALQAVSAEPLYRVS